MNLPKIDLPLYDLKLPSNGKEIKVRPFLVKEEKLLLMAVYTDDPQEIIKTTKQVINNCIIEPTDLNLDILPFFDIDYLFIALRAKSVGENIKINYICKTKIDDDKTCDSKFPVEIDISNVVIDKRSDISTEIRFSDNLIFNMKYPPYSIIKSLDEKDSGLEKKIKLISVSIDRIFANNQYYSNKDLSPEEIKTFIENLTHAQFEKLDEFVSNYPTFHIRAEGNCSKCGKNHVVRFDDFVNFFQ